MKALRDMDPLVTLAFGLVGGMAYVFTNFASVAYVDKNINSVVKYADNLHTDAKAYSDQNFQRNYALLQQMLDMLKTLEARSWDLRGPASATINVPQVQPATIIKSK